VSTGTASPLDIIKTINVPTVIASNGLYGGYGERGYSVEDLRDDDILNGYGWNDRSVQQTVQAIGKAQVCIIS
jgi:hypothetical protein